MAPAPRQRRLAAELLEDRRLLSITPGVTVITHGAQLTAGIPDWAVTMGQAILDRADGDLVDHNVGSMFQHNPATGKWTAVDSTVWTNSNRGGDHIVLLYDWTQESGTLEDGWLEAAADNLFASLIDATDLPGDFQGRSFFQEAAAAGSTTALNLHLIGHSRGAVLNSLVAQRFDYFFPAFTIDQVTTLDAHPASLMNDPGYVGSSPSANSRVFTYDNVRLADNYFQQDGAYEPLFPPDFDGVMANGAYNFQLPSAVLENGGSILEHSDVHTWYYGTITQPFAANYAGFSGAGRNNDGDVSFPDAWWGASGVPSRGSTGFAFSQIGGLSRASLTPTGAKSASVPVPVVYDGDLSRAIDKFIGDSVPGWELHSGGGTAPLGGGADLYFELNAGGDDYFRTHNPSYFPPGAFAVRFDYWIVDNDANQPDDELIIDLGNSALGAISLGSTTAGFVRDQQANFGALSDGRVDRIRFRIKDNNGDGFESAVRIDNVRLAFQAVTPAHPGDYDENGFVDGADLLLWQRKLGSSVFAGARPDGDASGTVDAGDLAIWKSHFGEANLSAADSGAAGQLSPGALKDALFASGDWTMLAAEPVGRRAAFRPRALSRSK